jgi:hypothetical protein
VTHCVRAYGWSPEAAAGVQVGVAEALVELP